jgi:thioredoxin 1
VTEPTILTDQTLEDALNSNTPVLLLLTNGEGLRGEFKTAFNKAADETDGVLFAKIDPTANPTAAERFSVGEKPVMVAWAGGEVLARRVRPWGTDVLLAVDQLKTHIVVTPPSPQATPSDAPENHSDEPQNKETATVYDAPVNVTDDTFQNEVIDSDLPVLIDFWAEWCGPCRMVAPTLEKLAKEFEGKVKIAKVNVDENPGLSATFQIRSIPNMMAIKEKTIVFNQPGALPEPVLRDVVQQLIDLEIPAQEEGEASEESSAE